MPPQNSGANVTIQDEPSALLDCFVGETGVTGKNQFSLPIQWRSEFTGLVKLSLVAMAIDWVGEQLSASNTTIVFGWGTARAALPKLGGHVKVKLFQQELESALVKLNPESPTSLLDSQFFVGSGDYLQFSLRTQDHSWALHIQFDPSKIESVLAYKLLERIGRCLDHLQEPQTTSFDQLALLNAQEIKLLCDQAKGAVQISTQGQSIVGLFDQHAQLKPQAPALIWDGGSQTYQQLQSASMAIATELKNAGVQAGDVVCVAMSRQPAVYAALLGVLRQQAIYLPVDPFWPAARLASIKQQAGAVFELSELNGKVHINVLPRLAIQTTYQGRTDLAYIMFTSGSTGTPKGALITQKAIIRLTQAAQYMKLDSSLRMLQAAPLGFDASTLEIWGPLLNGGSCVLHSEQIPTARGLQKTISQFHVNSAWLTAALFNNIVDQGTKYLNGLTQLAIGGEALSTVHVRQILNAMPHLRLINGYGPTECTTFAATFDISLKSIDQHKSIPIGFALTNTVNRVLNPAGKLVPAGFVGELHIGGDGLAHCYVNNPELTAAKFIPDAYGTIGSRLYKTGDRVRLLANGALEFLGRKDNQIKLRGQRIELGEIETVLATQPNVKNACVLVRDYLNEPHLTAYVVMPAEQFSIATLREGLKQLLPDPIIPSQWVRLDQFPTTANGKLDRSALPPPGHSSSLPATTIVPTPSSTPLGLQEKVAQSFCFALGLASVKPTDHFFELGGTSLAVTRAAAHLEQLLGKEVAIASFFGNPTVQGITALLSRQEVSSSIEAQTVQTPHNRDADEPIAIIGMALKVPGADSLDAFWDNLMSGKDSISRFSIDQLDPSLSKELVNDPDYVAARGVIQNAADFDASFFGITPAEAALMDPQQRVFLELCWECMEHAGCAPDSLAHNSSVGVFAGVYNASYYQNHVLKHPEKIKAFGEFQVMLANEKDYVATRVAHRLNLNGPAVNVFTACSTSLVAMAQAIDQLRLRRCNAALAGGASITCPPNSGYLYNEGSMLSSDGVTRSFDAKAAGTVFSDGAAVVMLKRLSDAIAAGDTIHAVIRGVAVNNDGAGKASFTAPSVEGQAAVVALAHEQARVTADQIQYIEAHGTATPLGDPVEIEALKRAFAKRLNSKALTSCLIGSVKSNIGHTVMAAGAVGVIKTVLALKHQVIPASIHFESANPRLQLEDSPFTVVATSTAWPIGEQPRIAAVSSFGVGGTNAHLILQEAPPPVADVPPVSNEITPMVTTLAISARSAAAVQSSAIQLAQFLRKNSTVSLAQVEQTLVRGRKAFAHRLVVSGESVEQLSLALESASKKQGCVDQKPHSMTWLFPGQGAQYAHMGKALYYREPVIKAAMDSCFEVLQRRLKLDLKAILFDAQAPVLAQTENTQPALFTIEYALAQYWLSLGITPDRLIGHSVGEFVAATLAGVMTLEDAVYLVAKRGALMQALPTGSMLAVRISVADLAPLLPSDISLAVSNSVSAQVVAGPAHAIESFSAKLTQRDFAHRALATSHAFHSHMMQDAVEPFAALVSSISLNAPRLHIISSVTGKTLTAAQATDPQYWAQHLRLPVMFGDALKDACQHSNQLYLEVGPSQHLSTLCGPLVKQSVVIASLTNQAATEVTSLSLASACLWAYGVTDHAVKPQPHVARIALPTYPFERQTYWLDASVSIPMTSFVTPTTMNQPNTQTIPALAPAQASILTKELEQLIEAAVGVDLAGTDASARFTELGLDSLALTQVALQVKRTFGVKISFRDLMENYRSMQSLVAFILPTRPAPVATVAASQPASLPTPMVMASPSQATAAAAPMAQALLANNAFNVAANPGLAGLIASQLQVMQQQLALMGSGSVNVMAQPPVATPAVIETPTIIAPAQLNETAPASESAEATEPQKYDVKKAFGAIARIHTTRNNDLTTKQKNRLDALIERYTARTIKSKEYTALHRPHLADPRVVNGFRPQFKEIIYQIVIERSAGAHVWDIDGNRYVDALNGFGMSLFGWQPAFLTEALKKQIDLGYEIGPQHALSGMLAKQFCEITGSERAAFCNTGSEAVMGAVRIARTVTGKHLIVSFTGSYHGIFDEVVVRGAKNFKTVPAAPGIMNNAGDNVLVLEYGTEDSLRIIRERADDIAAVLVEPVQSRRPDFQPIDFLKSLRKLTSENEIALVFDEIVTGFRCHPGGIQALFGIQADMATYGKVVGGGLSIGVVAGKREYMDALDGGAWQYGDDSIPTVGVTYFAGTFVRHPLALAAAHAVLNHMKKQGPALQESLNQRTTEMVAALNEICKARQAPIEIRHFASVWRTTFLEDHPYQDLLFAMMRSRGIHILDNFPCFLTTAHSAEDINAIVEAFEDALIELQEGGFIPGRPAELASTMDNNKPPIAGARLGRNQEGKVVWFIENPDQAGKFIEYKSA